MPRTDSADDQEQEDDLTPTPPVLAEGCNGRVEADWNNLNDAQEGGHVGTAVSSLYQRFVSEPHRKSSADGREMPAGFGVVEHVLSLPYRDV